MKNVVLLMSAALLLPLAAQARPGGHGPGGFGGPKMLHRAAEILDLDDSTRQKIKDLAYEGEKATIEMRASLRAAELELHRALDQADPDRGAVMGRLEEVGQLKLNLKKHQIGLMLDVRALLTPEQVRELKKHHREFRKHRGHHGKRGKRGKWRRRGGPDAPDAPEPPED